MLTNEDLSELQTNLDNYRFIVERVIPTAYEPGVTDIDPDLADEITLLLDTRSWLDEFLAGHASDPALTEIRADVRMLDKLLLAKRQVLMELVPHFERIRGRTRVSLVGSQWWWYLDRLSTTETTSYGLVEDRDGGQLSIPVDPVLAARIGLHPGQNVRVTVVDDKHLVVTVN